MRKPLIAFGLAVTTGLGAVPAAGVLAAPNGHGTFSSPTTSRTSPLIPPAVSASTAAASNSVSGAQIVQTALKYIGFPYTTTGNSPSTGFSCIGFVSYVYRSNGIALPGDLGGALAFAAQVPFSDLQPGDILYFQNTLWTGLSHAAIYIGNGKFIHAEYYGYGVRISSFYNDSKDGNYWITKYLGANRPWAGVAYAPSTTATPPGESPPPPPALNTGTQTLSGRPAVVDVQSLHVRTGPSTKYTIQAVVRRGTSLTIIGRARGWYKVQLPSGAVGWVARLGISTGSAVAPKTSSSRKNPNIGRVSGPARTGAPALSRPHASASIRVSGLRVHSYPSLNAGVVTSVSTGQRVQVLARRNGWMKIRTATGQIGWVVSRYTSRPGRAVRSARSRTFKSYVYHAPKSVTRRRRARRAAFTSGPVLTAGVRVHAAPGLKARVIGLAAAGTHVRVLGYISGWVLVRFASGKTGYVYGAYVRA